MSMAEQKNDKTEANCACLNDRQASTRQWVERNATTNVSVDEEDSSSVVESSDCGDDYSETSEDEDDDGCETALGTSMSTLDVSEITQHLMEALNTTNNVQTLGNVKVENSIGVHIGNITNINGNIQIIHAGGGGDSGGYRPSRRKRNVKGKENHNNCNTTSSTRPKVVTVATSEEKEERVRRDAFMENIKFRVAKHLSSIIPRHTWLAQLPMDEYTYMEEPVKYVIIAHTATESSEKQAINIRIIRDIQCFHIESREWNDIAYNFLIGCDGNVYEGRGWGVVGAHTMGYNTLGLGIAFIGCFMRVMPSTAAMNACKNLLKRGVDEGHLDTNYRLVGHCQCRSTESPGRKLFEELQNWEHFYEISEDDRED